jgi:hypothetical protein
VVVLPEEIVSRVLLVRSPEELVLLGLVVVLSEEIGSVVVGLVVVLPEEIVSRVLLVRSPEELVLPPLKVLLVVSLLAEGLVFVVLLVVPLLSERLVSGVLLVVSLLAEGLVSGVLLVVSLLPEGLLSVVASPFPPPPLEPPLSADPPSPPPSPEPVPPGSAVLVRSPPPPSPGLASASELKRTRVLEKTTSVAMRAKLSQRRRLLSLPCKPIISSLRNNTLLDTYNLFPFFPADVQFHILKIQK